MGLFSSAIRGEANPVKTIKNNKKTLFMPVKRLESKGEEDRSQGIDTFREHCGRSLGGNLRENNTTFNSNRALGQVLAGELRFGA